ncbi:MAG: acetyl-CoA carboxylase biotin carboxyl carrier protein [Bacteroidetes bacterium]|nr:acetyl-CoA carboxylase biotin carboxyl carrier protein [Bacteroidota bacterium]
MENTKPNEEKNISKIKDLLKYVDQTGLEEVYIKTSDITLRIKRTPGPSSFSDLDNQSSKISIPETLIDSENETTKEEKSNTKIENLLKIKAPMIGTFYISPNPDSPPFVKVGDRISKGQTVCIIEAMKLFNEIEADHSGIVEKILVEDALPVEFDQPLFLIKPE